MRVNESPLIKASEVAAFVKNNKVVLIDARSGPDAFAHYLKSHVAGALHVDLDRDLSQKTHDPAKGGRHPLPELKTFTVLLGHLGITPATEVIVYDDKRGANAAARFWWMLRAVGHERVKVVDGGLEAIVKQNLPLTNVVTAPSSVSPYPADQWKLPTIGIEGVAGVVTDPAFCVIDVREAYRYRGEREPIDLAAGHIPGAINVPYSENLDEQGNFASPEVLADRYKKIIGDRQPENIIVHCGSGVTACHTLLALEHAGIKGARLYVGSWSEWSRSGRAVAVEDKS